MYPLSRRTLQSLAHCNVAISSLHTVATLVWSRWGPCSIPVFFCFRGPVEALQASWSYIEKLGVSERKLPSLWLVLGWRLTAKSFFHKALSSQVVKPSHLCIHSLHFCGLYLQFNICCESGLSILICKKSPLNILLFLKITNGNRKVQNSYSLIKELKSQLKASIWQFLYFEEQYERITCIEAIRIKK